MASSRKIGPFHELTTAHVVPRDEFAVKRGADARIGLCADDNESRGQRGVRPRPREPEVEVEQVATDP
jgi:hypothetical protein